MKHGLEVAEQLKLLETIRSAIATKSSKQFYTWLRDYVAILLGLEAGLRSGEAAKLLISHVWFAQDIKGTLILEENFNKRCKQRRLPITKDLINALRAYVPTRILWLPPGIEDGWLLSNKPGKRNVDKPLSSAALHYIVRYWADRAGIQHFRFHDLRHSFGTANMAVDNSNLKCVQDLLGHRSIQSTQVYLHTTTEQLAKVLNTAFPGADFQPPA